MNSLQTKLEHVKDSLDFWIIINPYRKCNEENTRLEKILFQNVIKNRK